MTERPGKLVYRSRHHYPVSGLLLFAIGMIFILLFLIVNGDVERANRDFPEMVLYFYLVVAPVSIIGLLMLIVSLFAIRRTLIFENGIIPGERPFSSLFREGEYFIPFGGIKSVGVDYQKGERVPVRYYFLMRDNTIAYCFDGSGLEETREALELAIKRRLPETEIRLLKKEGNGPGISFDEFSHPARDANGSMKKYRP